jgi:signal transduction histidine kinase
MSRRTGSIRFKITVLATLLVVVVLSVAGIVLQVVQQRTLTENLRGAIEQRADEIGAVLARGEAPIPALGGEDIVVQVVEGQSVTGASASLQGLQLLALATANTGDTWQTVHRLTLGQDRFLLLTRAVPSARAPLTLNVAGSLGDADEARRVLTKTLLLVVPIVALVLALATWLFVGRTLAPVEVIRGEVASISGRPGRRRVPQPRGNDEIARLAGTMNGLLDRIEQMQDSQDRFVADASHELRTPLTRMRSEVEVALASDTIAAPSATYRSLLDDMHHMQRLLDDLLQLARLDDDAAPISLRLVDLDDVVFAEAERLRGLGRRTVDVSSVSSAQVAGDVRALTRAIANLADNAERHASSAVAFGLAELNGWAELTVTDDGPGIPTDKAELVFQRFTRLDEARSASGGGSGLGLAIARTIVEKYGGTLVLDPTYTRGARFVMRLPTHLV